MKKNNLQLLLIIITISFSAISFSQEKPKGFIISGKLSNLKQYPDAVFIKSMENPDISYRVPVVNGKYVIKGILNGPTQFNLNPIYNTKKEKPKDINSIIFVYIDNSHTTIEHKNSFSNLQVNGSQAQLEFDTLDKQIQKSISEGATEEQINELRRKFLSDNPTSPISVYVLRNFSEILSQNRNISFEDIPFSLQNSYLLYAGRYDYKKALPILKKLPESLLQSDAGMTFNKDMEFAKLDLDAAPYRAKIDSLIAIHSTAIKSKNLKEASDLEKEMLVIESAMYTDVYEAYIIKMPSSAIAFPVLERIAQSNFNDPVKTKLFFDKLSETAKATNEAKDFKARLDIALKTSAIGMPAADFTQPDVSGKPVALSSYRGKYILLDFWASWCGPCRAENPNMIKLYNEYKDKDFTIISVSLDTDKVKWLKAIKTDNLPWVQLSDLKKENAAAKQYAILGIPANILINKEGVVVGKNLFGDTLGARLSEIIK